MNEEPALTDDEIRTAAADWFVRLAGEETSAADWDAFTGWLEASPRHAAAYDAVCEADDAMVALLSSDTTPAEPAPAPVPANDDEPFFRRRRGWIAGVMAIAASFFLAVFLWPAGQADFVTYRTAPGEVRTIALDGGSRIELNGATEIALAEGDVRRVRLTGGEAAFYVVDSSRAPFEVETGGLRLVDQGTVFNVARDAGWIRVGVAEGEILVNPGGENISLTAGRRLAMREGSDTIDVGNTDPSAVAGWRERRLSYSDAPVALVAADLARNLGVEIDVADDLAERRFTGVIQLDGDAAQVLAQAAPLFEARAAQTGEGWTLSSR
jgi:transmembrane sensor